MHRVRFLFILIVLGLMVPVTHTTAQSIRVKGEFGFSRSLVKIKAINAAENLKQNRPENEECYSLSVSYLTKIGLSSGIVFQARSYTNSFYDASAKSRQSGLVYSMGYFYSLGLNLGYTKAIKKWKFSGEIMVTSYCNHCSSRPKHLVFSSSKSTSLNHTYSFNRDESYYRNGLNGEYGINLGITYSIWKNLDLGIGFQMLNSFKENYRWVIVERMRNITNPMIVNEYTIDGQIFSWSLGLNLQYTIGLNKNK